MAGSDDLADNRTQDPPTSEARLNTPPTEPSSPRQIEDGHRKRPWWMAVSEEERSQLEDPTDPPQEDVPDRAPKRQRVTLAQPADTRPSPLGSPHHKEESDDETGTAGSVDGDPAADVAVALEYAVDRTDKLIKGVAALNVSLNAFRKHLARFRR